MNAIIYFENEEKPCQYNILAIEQIRQRYREEALIMISAGSFSSTGAVLEPSCAERSAEYAKAGADLILSLPVASILGGYGKKEFAGAALVQRLRTSDHLVIPCTPLPGQTLKGCEETLRSLAMLMFKEEQGYRRRLNENLKREMLFRDAQYQAVCSCNPEAQELLSFQENRYALWLLDAMLQLYYMPKAEFIPAPKMTFGEGTPENPNVRENAAQLLADYSEEQLIDISGSTTQMVQALLEHKEIILQAKSLEQITQLLRPAPADRARLFLLKAVLGIRKIYMQICSLHVFVPYCRVCAENPEKEELLKQLENESWVPFVRDETQLKAETENYHYLLQADNMAEELAAAPSGQEEVRLH